MGYRMFTIEIIVDFKDPIKASEFARCVQIKASEIFGLAGVLKDHVTPQIVVYSHDHDHGHIDLPLITSAECSRAQEDGAASMIAKEEIGEAEQDLINALKG